MQVPFGCWILDNDKTQADAVVVITKDESLQPLCAVYVRKGSSFDISGLKIGNYNFYFKQGDEWDNSSRSSKILNM